MREKENALISVIIPVYNVENYLRRCLDSVLNQSYKNLEIILVDDGSTDNSGVICDEYAQKDERIKIIHKANGGLSSARNIGLDVMKGDYISFVDSDDVVHTDMIKDLYRFLVCNDAQMATCKFKEFKLHNIPSTTAPQTPKVKVVSKNEALLMYEGEFGPVMISACAKLYEKSVFEKIRFPLNRKCEDLATNYKAIFASEKVVVLEGVYYFYVIRENSIMHSPQRPTDDNVLGFDEFIQYCQDNIDDEGLKKEMVALLLKRKADTILEDYYYSVKRKLNKSVLKHIEKLYYKVRPQLKEKGVLRPQYRVFELNPLLFCLCVEVYYRFIGRNME